MIPRRSTLTTRRPAKKGQTLVEYALILAFVAVVAIAVMINLGGGIRSAFVTVISQFTTAQHGGAAASGHGG